MELDVLAAPGAAPALLLVLCSGLVGGIVRGYSGFGFALAAVPLLSTSVPPILVVPAVLLHELAIGLATLKGAHRQVNRPVLGVLALGAVLGTPVGLMALSLIPEDKMRLVVAAAVTISVAVIWTNWSRPKNLNNLTILSAGLLSGLLNGATAMSAPPAILTLMGSSMPPAQVRSILIVFITFSATIGIGLSTFGGLYGSETILVALWMAPGVVIGSIIGARLFSAIPTRHYRRLSLIFLSLVAAASLAVAAERLV